MRLLIIPLIWLFGLACGLSIASWLITSEKIADAVIFLYISTGFAVVTFVLLVYLVLKHEVLRKR